MTTAQFLTIRGGLVSASVLIERDLSIAKNIRETRYVKRMAEKIDAGLRTLDSLADERTDQPRAKQQQLEVTQ